MVSENALVRVCWISRHPQSQHDANIYIYLCFFDRWEMGARAAVSLKVGCIHFFIAFFCVIPVCFYSPSFRVL